MRIYNKYNEAVQDYPEVVIASPANWRDDAAISASEYGITAPHNGNRNDTMGDNHVQSQHTIGDHKGFTLLLMIALLAAFLSIGIGITHILLGQVIIIGQAQESFKALYAADIAMERTLYRDRDPMQNVCGTIDPFTGKSECNEIISFPNGACYAVSVQLGPSASCPGPSTRCIDVTGQDICGGSQRFVRRSFNVKY